MRDEKVDIIKGLLIICVLLGHTGFPYSQFLVFQLPVFFMISGYLYAPKYSESIQGLLKLLMKRIKSLWIPYVIANIIFTLLHNPLKAIHVYDENILFLSKTEIIKELVKILFFAGGQSLTGALWFLRVLFFASIIFYFCCYIGRRLKYADGIFIFLFVIAASILRYFDINFMSAVYICSATICLFIGKQMKDRSFENYLTPIVIILSLVVLIGFGVFKLDNNILNYPILVICITIPGGGDLLYVSKLIIKYFTIAQPFFTWCGKHTLSILILHFSMFKIISYFGILIYHDPIEKLGAFPYLYTGIWDYIYVVGALFGCYFILKLKDAICIKRGK